MFIYCCSAWLYSDGQYDDQLTVNDVTLFVLPMFHQFGFICMLFYLSVGYQVVVMPQFKPDEYVRLVDKYKVNASVSDRAESQFF